MAPPQATLRKHLQGAQQADFIQALREADSAAARILGEALAAGTENVRTPQLAMVPQADGSVRSYVLSAKVQRGKYGRFRRARRGDGAVVGIKDFRLPERFDRDVRRRVERLQALVQQGAMRPEMVRQIGLNEAKLTQLVRDRRLTLMDVATVARNRDIVQHWVATGQLTAEEGSELLFDRAYFEHIKALCGIKQDVAEEITAAHFCDPASIDAEYDLLRAVQSPLAEMERFSVNDRLFVVTRAMDMDAFTLAKMSMDPAARAGITRHLLVQLARGLARFHAAGIVHRDVKLENALLDISGNAEPADPGLATRLSAEGTATKTVGTLQYAAPEMVGFHLNLELPACPPGRPYTQAVDVFSLGVSIAGAAVRRNLIRGDNAEAVAALVDLVRLREAAATDANTGLCDLQALFAGGTWKAQSAGDQQLREVLEQWHAIDAPSANYVFTRMLAVDPGERATMAEVHAHFAADAARVRADAALTTLLVREHVQNDLSDEYAVMAAFASAASGPDGEKG